MRKIPPRFYLFVALSTILFACQPIGLWLNGVKNPKVENSESIHAALKRYGLKSDYTVISSFNSYRKNYFDFGLTEIHIFSKNGDYIAMPNDGSNKCGPDPIEFIKSLEKDDFPISKKNIFFMTDRFLTNDGKPFVLKKKETTDFICVVSWAVWNGKKIIERDLGQVITAIHKNKNANFEVILLNMDKQEIWGETNLKKIKTTRTSLQISQ